MSHFTSRHHPKGQSAAVVYGQDLVRPLGLCMLPVMIFALVEVLSGRPALAYLYLGFPVAAFVASGWTVYSMRQRPALLTVGESHASVASREDVAWRRDIPLPRAVLDVRTTEQGADITIGLSSFHLTRRDWPEFDGMVRTLREARRRHTEQVQGRLEA